MRLYGLVVTDNIGMEHNRVYVKAARNLFNECDEIDGELKGDFSEKEK